MVGVIVTIVIVNNIAVIDVVIIVGVVIVIVMIKVERDKVIVKMNVESIEVEYLLRRMTQSLMSMLLSS